MENATTIRSRLRDEVYQIVENEFRTTMPNSNTELPEFNKWRKDKIYRTLALLSNFLANNKTKYRFDKYVGLTQIFGYKRQITICNYNVN